MHEAGTTVSKIVICVGGWRWAGEGGGRWGRGKSLVLSSQTAFYGKTKEKTLMTMKQIIDLLKPEL